jgi:hypothetical protein
MASASSSSSVVCTRAPYLLFGPVLLSSWRGRTQQSEFGRVLIPDGHAGDDIEIHDGTGELVFIPFG